MSGLLPVAPALHGPIAPVRAQHILARTGHLRAARGAARAPSVQAKAVPALAAPSAAKAAWRVHSRPAVESPVPAAQDPAANPVLRRVGLHLLDGSPGSRLAGPSAVGQAPHTEDQAQGLTHRGRRAPPTSAPARPSPFPTPPRALKESLVRAGNQSPASEGHPSLVPAPDRNPGQAVQANRPTKANPPVPSARAHPAERSAGRNQLSVVPGHGALMGNHPRRPKLVA